MKLKETRRKNHNLYPVIENLNNIKNMKIQSSDISGFGDYLNNSFNQMELNVVILTFFTDAFSCCVGFTSSIK